VRDAPPTASTLITENLGELGVRPRR